MEPLDEVIRSGYCNANGKELLRTSFDDLMMMDLFLTAVQRPASSSFENNDYPFMLCTVLRNAETSFILASLQSACECIYAISSIMFAVLAPTETYGTGRHVSLQKLRTLQKVGRAPTYSRNL